MDWRELHDTKTKGELAKMVVDLQSQLEKEERAHKKIMWLFAEDIAGLESQLEKDSEGCCESFKKNQSDKIKDLQSQLKKYREENRKLKFDLAEWRGKAKGYEKAITAINDIEELELKKRDEELKQLKCNHNEKLMQGDGFVYVVCEYCGKDL